MNKIPCICGHLEKDHTNYATTAFPIQTLSKCDLCLLIGKANFGVFHEYMGDNLRYLESLVES